MKKVCAFMSVFNEEDIIDETISSLIENGVDVYVIDNGCTDRTVEKLNKYVGRGIIDIQHFITVEDGVKVFSLIDILSQFENVARSLPHDWFLISDADEIKCSPWVDVCLREGIDKVDALEYNLINFKLFDFRPTYSSVADIGFEASMQYYSKPHQSSAMQMKCWKRSNNFDIKSFGGHVVSRPNPRLFPVKFINKHYPIRGKEHGYKKLKSERFDRYSKFELAKGWHTHYSDIDINDQNAMVWNEAGLSFFDLNSERASLFSEAMSLFFHGGLVETLKTDEDIKRDFLNYTVSGGFCDLNHAIDLFNVARNLYSLSSKYRLPSIVANDIDKNLLRVALKFFHSRDYLSGRLLESRGLDSLFLESFAP